MCNFVPVQREHYRIGVPYWGTWAEVFTSDNKEFGGEGVTNGKNIQTIDESMHGCEQCIELTLPANTVFFLECVKPAVKPKAKEKEEQKPQTTAGASKAASAQAAKAASTQAEA